MRVQGIFRRRSRADSPPGDRTYRLLASFLRPHRLPVAFVAAAAFVGGLVEALILLIIARAALAIASGDGRFEVPLGPFGDRSVTVEAILVVAGVLVAVRVLLQYVQARATARTFAELTRTTRRELLDLYLGATWRLQSQVRQGRLQELMSSMCLAATGAAAWVVTVIVAGLSFAALVLTALAVNVVASLVVGVIALLLAAAFHPLRRMVQGLSRRSLDVGLDLAATVSEVSNLTQEIRVFEAAPAVTDWVGAQIHRSASLMRRQRMLTDLIPAVYQAVSLGVLVLALLVVQSVGVSQLSALSAVVLIMLRSLGYGQTLQRAVQGIHESAPNLQVLTDELERFRDEQIPTTGRPVEGIGGIVFDHVSFSYDGVHDALDDVSFETRRGEVIGIVGPSGSGKSTLMQIILRLRDPARGRVLVDGSDVVELSLESWYRHVTFVPQDAHLFEGTVAENIRFFRDSIADEEVVAAARLANLDEEIRARPGGYDSQVGSGGRELSGGQRQRLCIARALVDHPDVLVLDEPTSALDLRSESLIRDALQHISAETTIFIIAHRLSTLAICDRIMVLQGGALVGFDDPERLEQTTPFYRQALELAGLK